MDAHVRADCIIVEVQGQAAGVLANFGGKFEFFASAGPAFRLNGKTFRSAREALTAVAEAMSGAQINKHTPGIRRLKRVAAAC